MSNSSSSDNEQPRRKKRRPMFYKQYLHKDSKVKVPRTTLRPPAAGIIVDEEAAGSSSTIRSKRVSARRHENVASSDTESNSSENSFSQHDSDHSCLQEPEQLNPDLGDISGDNEDVPVQHSEDVNNDTEDSSNAFIPRTDTTGLLACDPSVLFRSGGGDGDGSEPSGSGGESSFSAMDHGGSSDDSVHNNNELSTFGECSDHEGSSSDSTTASEDEDDDDFDGQFVRRARDMNNRHSLDENIFSNQCTPRTKFECLFLVLSYAMRHSLSDVAIEDLVKLIKCLLGEMSMDSGIPSTLHVFQKIFSFECGLEFHFYCSKCEAYIGKKSDFKKGQIVKCPVQLCGEKCDISKLNGQNFFLTLPLKYQLKCYLESQPDIADILSYRFNREPSDGTVRDIFDGELYKKLAEGDEILSGVDNFSLTVNTDGSPIFLSANNSMWPIQCRVNELPPNKRFSADNMFLSGIWFGSKHPNMNVYMAQFALECRDLEIEGFQWTKPPGELVRSKVVVLSACLDSVAKPTVQCMMQFNAYCSCGYCYHPGNLVDVTNNTLIEPEPDIPAEHNVENVIVNDMGEPINDSSDVDANQSDSAEEQEEQRPVVKIVKQVRFITRNGAYPERTDSHIRADMVESVTTKKVVRGVKGMSPLIVLFSLNLVYGFVIDYMHSVLLGVTKQLLSLWLDPKFRSADFSIRDHITRIDERLLNLKPPLNISRRPRSINSYIRWKANELRSWLLYYCLPCLLGILPDMYFNHLILLVTSIYILSSYNISVEELHVVETNLLTFVNDFEILYGPAQMVYNVHLLTHLTQCVRYWGPLWAYSAFSFESGNGHLKNLVKGTRGVVTQISRKYCMSRFLPKIISCYEVSHIVASYCKDLLVVEKRGCNVDKVSSVTV